MSSSIPPSILCRHWCQKTAFGRAFYPRLQPYANSPYWRDWWTQCRPHRVWNRDWPRNHRAARDSLRRQFSIYGVPYRRHASTPKPSLGHHWMKRSTDVQCRCWRWFFGNRCKTKKLWVALFHSKRVVCLFLHDSSPQYLWWWFYGWLPQGYLRAIAVFAQRS